MEGCPGLIRHQGSFLIRCSNFVHSVLGLEGPPLLDASLLLGKWVACRPSAVCGLPSPPEPSFLSPSSGLLQQAYSELPV